jgi:archaellum component FlaF (FlaF/FlaG flagellin family)
MGLVKDDYADMGEWFRFKKKNVNDQKHTEVKMTSFKHQKEISATEEKQYENGSKSEKRSPNIFDISVFHDHEDKKIIENLILEPLQKQVRNLIDAQSQTIKQIELQIKKSRGRLQLNKT